MPHHFAQELPHYVSPCQALKAWPPDAPLVFLGGPGRFAILALQCTRADPKTLTESPLPVPTNPDGSPLPFTSGMVGFLPYHSDPKEAIRESILFEVHQALVFDQEQAKTYLVGQPKRNAQHQVDPNFWRASRPESQPQSADSWELIPQASDQHYLDSVKQALEDIASGRYYQINLLRYFDLTSPLAFDHVLERFNRLGGPFGAWLRIPGTEIVSFSPERFFQIIPENDGYRLESTPIKGTIASSSDSDERARLGHSLVNSQKDQAELHMIVDLLRNDMNRVSQPGSLQVTSPGTLKDFGTVQHLVARITSQLQPNLTFGEILGAIYPGGSITGAPKKEVMKAIQEYEGRSRGFFMGSAFYLDQRSGRFDSSILIRTIVKQHKTEYAAGSGIVIKSSPEDELQEIKTKCQVITKSLRDPGLGENPAPD